MLHLEPFSSLEWNWILALEFGPRARAEEICGRSEVYNE